MDRAKQHKQRYYPSISVTRKIRANEMNECRTIQREKNRFRMRNMSTSNDADNPNNGVPKVKNHVKRQHLLLKAWKMERDMKKKLEAQNKKPIFKVGIPHHHCFSPTKNDPPSTCCHYSSNKKCKQNETSAIPKQLSLVTKKRIAARKNAALSLISTSSSKYQRNDNGSDAKKKIKTILPERNVIKNYESFAPINYRFKVPLAVNSLPMFGKLNFVESKNLTKRNITESLKAEKTINTMKRQMNVTYEMEKVEDTEGSFINDVNIDNNVTKRIKKKVLIFDNEIDIAGNTTKVNERSDQSVRLLLNLPIINITPPTPKISLKNGQLKYITSSEF